MIELLGAAIIAAALRRGYRRGAPRELLDLIVVAIGFPIAFRTGAPIGEWLFGDWAPLPSRTLGAIVVFGGISLLALGASRSLARGELDNVERRLGAAIGGIRGFLVSIIVIAVVAAAPSTSTLGRIAQDSWLVSKIGDPEGPAMNLFASATGERGMVALISFNRAFPDGPLVAEGERRIPSFPADELMVLRAEGTEILDLVNAERAGLGIGQLSWSSALTSVATDYAEEMYTGGFFAHVSPRTGDVGSRLRAVGIAFSLAGENLALAPNVATVHSGLMNSPGAQSEHSGAGVHEHRNRGGRGAHRDDRRPGIFPALNEPGSLSR